MIHMDDLVFFAAELLKTETFLARLASGKGTNDGPEI